MKRSWMHFVVLVLVAALSGCSVSSGPINGIKGYIYVKQRVSALEAGQEDVVFTATPMASDDYVPLKGAEIKIRHEVTGQTRRTTTNSEGYFVFSRLDPGYWILTVESLRDHIPERVWVDRDKYAWVKGSYEGLGYYVVIGVSRYANGEVYPGPDQDAKRIYDTLYMGNVLAAEGTLLINSQATKENIRRAIDRYVQMARSAKDYLVIYFSGYSGADFLSPYDDDHFGPDWSKAITDTDLEEWTWRFPGNITVIIDGSHSETMADGNPFEPLALQEWRYTVLTGAHADERVNYAENIDGSGINGSVFTYYLWEGLRTRAADENKDGDITAWELYCYTDYKMAKFYSDKPESLRHYPFIYPGRYGDTVIFRY